MVSMVFLLLHTIALLIVGFHKNIQINFAVLLLLTETITVIEMMEKMKLKYWEY